MINEIPMEQAFHINAPVEEYERFLDLKARRLYLTSEIESSDEESDGLYRSKCMQIVDDIISYNRYDAEHDIPAEYRQPIRFYINSPGGDIREGFSVVSAIKLSKTPIYTINIGMWCSMAFLIGITGHKRFSLPYMSFLMHDGTNFVFDSGKKAQDRMEFDRRFSEKVIKNHVLECSNMNSTEYDALSRVEYYMLPEDALEHGFIDEVVSDIDVIL